MKKFVWFLALGAVSAAVAAPTLTIDSVRQRWPFSQKVDIAFTLSGAESGECYALKDFKVYNGDQAVAVSSSDFENIQPAYQNGAHSIVFDPSRTSLTNTLAVSHFKVGFSVSETPVRYLVLDLTKRAGETDAVEYVYAGDPRLESYEQAIDYLDADGVTPKQTSITYEDAWLSLSNKTFVSGGNATSPYALTKMAFRLVKPGDFVVGPGTSETYNDVTLTKPYFVAVTFLTMGQYGQMRYGDWMQKDTAKSTSCTLQSRSQPVYMDDLRGAHNDPVYPVDWIQYGHQVCPTSFIGQVRAKYGFAFDIPTEAQWEVAARARTRGYYYVNDSSIHAANTNLLTKIGNLGGTSNVIPCEKLANAWGLFDLLYYGQSVLDNIKTINLNKVSENPWPSGTDPVGAGSDWNGKTFSKGGGHSKGSVVSVGARGGNTTSTYGDWTSAAYNAVRLVINVD